MPAISGQSLESAFEFASAIPTWQDSSEGSPVTAYSELLAKGARELRHYNGRAGRNSAWGEKIAGRMEAASALATEAAQEREIKAILRLLVDSGPSDESASPSFSAAADAMQRAAKRR